MKGIGRNDPCWCGSGTKYKKCHLNRDNQEKDNPWEAVTANKKAFHAKRCFADNVGLGPCEGRIIKAHTISRGPNLSQIATNGKVIGYSADVAQFNNNGGRLVASDVGIGAASVFHGFCARHDRVLYSCIENETFVGRADQCLAVAYRTLSREYYGKNAAGHLRETLRGADKGASIREQVQLQAILDLIDQGNELAKKDLKHTHDALTKAIVEGDEKCLQSTIIEFGGVLPFMAAGAWSPFTDLYGHELQKGYEDELLEQIFVSTFVGNGVSRACLSWLKVDGVAPGQVISQQIRQLPKDKQASALLQLIAKHVENIFFRPDWFSALSIEQRKQMDVLAASGMDSLGSVPDAAIDFKLDLDLPISVATFDVP